jgi:hypothetical protein
LESNFSFGKYEGKQVKEIIESDFTYLVWCAKKLDHFYLTSEVVETIKNLSPNGILAKAIHPGFVTQLESDELKMKTHLHDEFDMDSIRKIITDPDKLSAIEEVANSIILDEDDDDYETENDYYEDPTDWSSYNDDLDPDQQGPDFWNQF